jgi:hypothetical protein
MTSAELWALWLSVAANFVIATIALFQHQIHDFLRAPSLTISFRLIPPHCQKVGLQYSGGTAAGYFLRLLVKNEGWGMARNVEIFMEDLSVWDQETKLYHTVSRFWPMNLRWAYSGAAQLDTLLPGFSRYCDLGWIPDPAMRNWFFREPNYFAFKVEFESASENHLVPAGQYRAKLLIGGSNFSRKRYRLDLNLTGQWSANEDEMLTKHISGQIQALS